MNWRSHRQRVTTGNAPLAGENLRNPMFIPHQAFTLSVVFSILALAPLAAAETSPDLKALPAPARIIVPKLQGRADLDGELGEAMWAKAAELTPFQHNDGSGPGRESTRVRIWY